MRRLLLLVGAAVVVSSCTVLVAAASGSAWSGQERWVITDLGTLGGTWSEAVAINDLGQVVGSADLKGEGPEGDALWHAFLWQRGRMRDLGTLGGSWSRAVAINDRGQVIGNSETKATYREFGSVRRKDRAFLWQDGKMLDLGTLGGPNSEALAINGRGDVVGVSDTKVNTRFNGPVRHVFLWQAGKMRDIGPLGAQVAINDRGQVTGSRGGRAILWRNGTSRDLGTLGGRTTWPPQDINERGVVVGVSQLKSGSSRAFVWTDGEMRNLGVLPGDRYSEAIAMNERGTIVGYSGKEWNRLGDPVNTVAFVYVSGKMTSLGTLGGKGSYANAINESGQIVGSSNPRRSLATHAFVWANGRMTDLGALSGSRSSEALVINDHNQIIGTTDKAGTNRAALWTLRSG